jgi:UDP-N-acetylglucosamine acyltransferase
MVTKGTFISKSSIVSGKALIHHNAYIGEGCLIKDYAEIGMNAVIEKNTTIGEHTRVYPYACLGGDPQDVSYNGEETFLEIGDNCIIREFSTIHRGSVKGGCKTTIGNNCFIMCNTHIGHDCKIGNGVIITSYTGISGHVVVEDFANISGFVAIHQFVRVGKYSMTGGMSRVVKDVPPFMIVEGSPARVRGLNIVGLKRRGINSDVRKELWKATKIYINKGNLISEFIYILDSLKSYEEILYLKEFFKKSKRGVVRK